MDNRKALSTAVALLVGLIVIGVAVGAVGIAVVESPGQKSTETQTSTSISTTTAVSTITETQTLTSTSTTSQVSTTTVSVAPPTVTEVATSTVTVTASQTPTIRSGGTAITVQTNDPTYSGTAQIAITGTVTPAPTTSNSAVVLTTKGPSGVVDIADVPVAASTGVYSYNLVAGSSLWVTGTYTVNATWGFNGLSATSTTTFTYAVPAATMTTATLSPMTRLPLDSS